MTRTGSLANTPAYPIRVVARMTGLSLDTIRAWERRYEAVVPRRNKRGRVYSESQVARLRLLAELVKRGHAIGTIAQLAEGDLEGLLQSVVADGAAREAIPTADLTAILDAVERYDLTALEASLNRFAVLLPPADLVFSVALPLLHEVGRRWEAGELRPAQEHLASAVVRSVLGGLLRVTHTRSHEAPVVFATPQGERHELGLLCGALLAASAGFPVLYLGPDLPGEDIAHAVARAGATLVVMSATTPGAVRPDVLRALDRETEAEVWVGGPAAPDVLEVLGRRHHHLESLSALVSQLRSRQGAR